MEILKVELKKTVFDKISHDKAINNAKKMKYDGYGRGLFQWITIYFDKRIVGGVNTFAQSSQHLSWKNEKLKNETILNKEIAEELHKPIIRKVK